MSNAVAQVLRYRIVWVLQPLPEKMRHFRLSVRGHTRQRLTARSTPDSDSFEESQPPLELFSAVDSPQHVAESSAVFCTLVGSLSANGQHGVGGVACQVAGVSG